MKGLGPSIVTFLIVYVVLSVIVPWFGFGCPNLYDTESTVRNVCLDAVGGLGFSPVAAVIALIPAVFVYKKGKK